jgi:predicted HTH domain antitoxin
MKTITINELQTKFNSINKSLKNHEYLLLTNKNNAIGLLSSFPDELFEQGFIPWIGIKAFQNGDLTLRQLAGLLKMDIDNVVKLLNNLNIPIIDYDFSDDVETIKNL